MSFVLTPAGGGLPLRLHPGSNVLGRGMYTGVSDERVSREALCVLCTTSGTVVVVCVGRNAAAVRTCAGAKLTLLQVRLRFFAVCFSRAGAVEGLKRRFGAAVQSLVLNFVYFVLGDLGPDS